MERRESVVQGGTDSRERREVPSSFKEVTPRRVNSHPIVRGADDPTHVAHTSNQYEVKDAKTTVEVPQMHDTNKIARRCCAETEEGLKRSKEMNHWQRKTAEAHLVQYIDRVEDVPVEKEPGAAEDAGSCCTKCYSDVKPLTDIRLLFKYRQLKTLRTRASTSTFLRWRGRMVPVAWTTPSTWTFRARTPWCRLRKRLWTYSRCSSLSVLWRFFRSSARKLSGT